MLVDEDSWDLLWFSWIAASLVMGIYAAFQIKSNLDLSQNIGRIDGSFGNPTYLSVFMLVAFFINMFMFTQKKLPLVWFSIIGLLQVTIIYFTGTRGAAIGLLGGVLLIAFIFAIWDKNRPIIRKFSIGVLASIFCVAIGFFAAKDTQIIQESPYLSRFASISLTEVSNRDGRLFVWPIAIEGFKEKPVLGWGQEGFRFVFDQNYDPRMHSRETWFDRAHSIPLDWLVAGGILGLLSYLCLYLFALLAIWKKTKFSFASKSVLTGLIAAYFIQNLFVFDNLISYILFFSLLAFLHTQASVDSSSKIDSLYSNRTLAKFTSIVFSIGLLASLYAFVYKPILASQSYVKAQIALQSGQGLTNALNFYEKSFSSNVFKDTFVVEQASNSAINIFRNEVPALYRERYFNLVDSEYQKALNIYADDSRNRFFYGNFLNNAGFTERALEQYKIAASISPNRQNILFHIAAVLIDHGMYQEAMNATKKAFELDPNFTQARILYGVTLLYAGANIQAQEILDEVPIEALVVSGPLVAVLEQRGDINALIQLFTERAALFPKDFASNVKLAEYYIRADRHAAAVEILEGFLLENPEHEAELRTVINDLKTNKVR
jgi:tetratricopeptide (TPR) repeat protein